MKENKMKIDGVVGLSPGIMMIGETYRDAFACAIATENLKEWKNMEKEADKYKSLLQRFLDAGCLEIRGFNPRCLYCDHEFVGEFNEAPQNHNEDCVYLETWKEIGND